MNSDSTNSPMYVLVIDDEPEILEIVRQCLEIEKVPVLTALGARKGLEMYEEHWRKIGVVLLDYLMPEMTGDLVLECLQQFNP